jgi:hypothetical protein
MPTKRRRSRIKTTLLIVGASILFVTLLFAAFAYQQNILATLKDDFTINFPTKPTIEKRPGKDASGQKIIITSYTSEVKDPDWTRSYGVIAYRWPEGVSFEALSETDLRSALQAQIDGTMAGINASEFKANNVNTRELRLFSNKTLALEESFTMHVGHHETQAFQRVFGINNHQYTILAFHADRPAFEKFADSFSYTRVLPTK